MSASWEMDSMPERSSDAPTEEIVATSIAAEDRPKALEKNEPSLISDVASNTAPPQEESGECEEVVQSDESFLEFEPVLNGWTPSYGLRESTDEEISQEIPWMEAKAESTVPLPLEESKETAAPVLEEILEEKDGQTNCCRDSPKQYSKKAPSRSASVRDIRRLELPKEQVQQLVKCLSHRRPSENCRPAKPSQLAHCTSFNKIDKRPVTQGACADSSTQCDIPTSMTGVKHATKELLRLLSDPDLADDVQVECAEKALQRYISPVIQEQEFRAIMETERALEEELLGLDRELIEKIPKDVDDRLCRRAKAVAAAETVAINADHGIPSRQSSLQSRRSNRPSCKPREGHWASLESCTHLPTNEDLIDSISTLQEAYGHQPPTSPRPSAASSSNGSDDESSPKAPMTKLQAQLSRRFASSKHLDVADFTAVYDRNCLWLKRHECKLEEAQRQKDRESMKECSFQPRLASSTPSTPKNESTEPKTTETEESLASDAALSKKDRACMRLYKKAQELHAKKYSKAEQFISDERQALSSSTPRARPMPSHVYGSLHPFPAGAYKTFTSKLRPLPSGVEECTFHPRTNIKRTWTAPSKTRQNSFWSLVDFSSTDPFEEDTCEETSLCGTEKATHNIEDSSREGCENEAEQEATEPVVPSMSSDAQQLRIMKKSEPSAEQEADESHKNEDWDVESNDPLIATFFERLSQKQDTQMVQKEQEQYVDFTEYQEGPEQAERGYYSDSKDGLEKKTDSGLADRLHLTQYAGTVRLVTDVDFSEFLKRQENYLENKNQKIKALRGRKEPNFQLAPGTKRILKDKKAQLQAAKSDTGSLVSYCDSFNDGSVSLSGEEYTQSSQIYRRSNGYCSLAPDECSFSPRITKKAKRLGRRTVSDFLRRSEKAKFMRESQRLENELKEQMHLTFKPKVNKNYNVPSKLNLKDPEAYMQIVRRRHEEKRLQQIKARQKKEAAELESCTFRPEIVSSPPSTRKGGEGKFVPGDTRGKMSSYPTWGYSLTYQTRSFA